MGEVAGITGSPMATPSRISIRVVPCRPKWTGCRRARPFLTTITQGWADSASRTDRPGSSRVSWLWATSTSTETVMSCRRYAGGSVTVSFTSTDARVMSTAGLM